MELEILAYLEIGDLFHLSPNCTSPVWRIESRDGFNFLCKRCTDGYLKQIRSCRPVYRLKRF